MLAVGLIGAGRVGQQRAAHLSGARLAAVSDRRHERAMALAGPAKADVITQWESLVQREDLDVIIIATPHDQLTAIALAALECGKHVLVERPAGRNPHELGILVKAAGLSKRILRVGFTHRFHPAVQRAKSILAAEGIGRVLHFRGRYGHGGRLGFENEWRANPAISGGGALLDLGTSLMDLVRWLGGEWKLRFGRAMTHGGLMKVEDQGLVFLEAPERSRSALLTASYTEGKPVFEFEVVGQAGTLQIRGLGGDFGAEQLLFCRRRPEIGTPEEVVTPFPDHEFSWTSEFEAFIKELTGQKTDMATAHDALKAVEWVTQTYDQSALTFER